MAGLAAVVLIFALITTCIRRRRARKFDRDVAEAAAAAAREAEAADPFIQEEEARMAGNWKNPVNPHGYGKVIKISWYKLQKLICVQLDEDPYGYVPAGVAGAGYGLHSQYPQHHGDAYGMSNLGNPQQQSMYSGTSSTQYGSNPGGAAYYMNDPNDFGRAPSVATNYTGPGFAGVGSGVPNHPVYYNGAAAYDNSHLRYRGQQLPPGKTILLYLNINLIYVQAPQKTRMEVTRLIPIGIQTQMRLLCIILYPLQFHQRTPPLRPAQAPQI